MLNYVYLRVSQGKFRVYMHSTLIFYKCSFPAVPMLYIYLSVSNIPIKVII